MRRTLAALVLALPAFISQPWAADGAADHPDAAPSSAQIEIDGVGLFGVRGVPAFPAAERARSIVQRIEAAAADPGFKVEDLRTVDSDLGTAILAGDRRVMMVTDEDARLEGGARKLIAEVYAARMREGIQAWRAARTPEALERGTIRAVAATVLVVLALGLGAWLWRRLRGALEGRYRARIHSVGIQSFQIFRAERIWDIARRLVGTAVLLLVFALLFAYLNYVLLLFPWTKGAGARLLESVLEPLRVMGRGLIAQLPNLVFLAILFVLTRWLLKVIHLFFGSVGRGEVTFGGFEPDWSEPTYKLVRVAVVALALVIAYPYIPGSSTDAFKGISVFIGVVLSIGSSSIIANMLAGYMMTYRRAFKVGDRVKIGDVTGDVREMRLQATHVKTIKNEDVIVPNSKILADQVVNYSSLARSHGLILHTAVGIGYETPWRQVEAMLIEAARRTPGLMAQPAPFVRQKSLGDFAVLYELNACCGSPHGMEVLYTEMHRNILDVFNEHGVQIMTPAYERDPAEPKVVPRDHWYASPAAPEDAPAPKPAGGRPATVTSLPA